MKLSAIAVKNKTISVEHPNYEGFIVDVVYMEKKRTKELLDKATTQTFSKKTHQLEAKVNNEVFLKLYTKALIKGWKGLKFEYVMDMMPISIEEDLLGKELEYDEDNALELISNAPNFDQWITSIQENLGNFSSTTSNTKKA